MLGLRTASSTAPAAVLDFEAFCLSLEVSNNRRAVVRHVIGMDPIEPLLSRRKFLGRQRYEVIEARRRFALFKAVNP
jgi:hypothetical protein